jgi:hypothetical protein
MRRILILSVLLAAGCQNLNGPFKGRSPVRVDDPRLSIEEQERLGRDRLALPDESIAPPSGAARPGQSPFPL